MSEMKLENFRMIGCGFYNLKTPFFTSGIINVGNQMSLLRLQSTGRFLVLDTCALSTAAKKELDYLTENGSLIDAVIATHPFHTMFFKAFYAMYPMLKYYGTPRHIKTITTIPWAGDVNTEAVRAKWEPEVEMRIPDGAEFAEPAESNHFSSVFVFHKESKTIHDDDTLMYFDSNRVGCCLRLVGVVPQKLYFHPSLSRGGLYKFRESAAFFKEWVQKVICDWDFDNICTAHYGVLIGNGKKMLRQTLRRYEMKFQNMSRAQSTRIPFAMQSSVSFHVGKSKVYTRGDGSTEQNADVLLSHLTALSSFKRGKKPAMVYKAPGNEGSDDIVILPCR